MKQASRRAATKELKYPLFLIGLAVMICGGVGIEHYGLPLNALVGTVVVGFILMFLGIVLE